MARFSLLITSAPHINDKGLSAYRFAQTVLNSEHQLQGVFFYQDGVHHANALQISPSSDFDLYQAWTSLAKTHQCPLLVCVTAATKRGVLSARDAADHDKIAVNLADPFQALGLGELAVLLSQSDRLVQF
jgi:tRNA 2-thiouridine synthesizing protein D